MLSSCMVGPNYHEPKKKVARYWLQNNPAVKIAPIQNANWWKVFHDPNLTFLIHKGYHDNLSLQATGVKVLQARAQLAQAVGQLYPQKQALTGSYTYYRIGGSEFQTVLPPSFKTATLGITASWEIDFWGKYRRAILAKDALFFSSLAAYDQALVTLTADIADTYINIRTAEQQIRVTKQNIAVQTQSLRIAKARYRGGQTSLLDVEQAETALAETQATLPKYVTQLQTNKDILAVLLGTVPTDIDRFLQKSKGIPKAPPTVAIGIPKEAMARRPDIYQARMEAIAQSETIGATEANLYPALSLSGTFVFAANTIGNNSLSDLFNWSNRNIVAGPSFVWPILNYGQITNAVRAQDAAFQQSLLNYVNLVLKAQQEVQDNITSYIEARKTANLLKQANTSAIRTTKLSITRYRQGENDYSIVLDAERQQLRIETNLVTTQGDIAKSLVALYRSLGGGWQIRGCNDVIPLKVKAAMAVRTNWGDLLEQPNHQYPANNAQQIKELYLPNW
ncbi:efflux transporter outer membrane subunit [Legionella sp. D16C41]|uniref:efflux transporter outer membrane subunit n=1 Tax=Legionella sp. D16C41 TaxID=3402688 RepID=UPI003AF51313